MTDAQALTILETLEAVAAGVADTLARLDDRQAATSGRIEYTEPEAAAILGVQPHALRDCRLRGEIAAAKVGRKVIYARAALEKFCRGRTST